MSYYYRCMKCRRLHTFKKPLEHYKRHKKCKDCNHWRFYVDKQKTHRTDYCMCDGYHFTHRKGSPFCKENPNYEFNVRTRRYGENPVDVVLDMAWDAQPTSQPESEEVPF